jgi:putative flippase GtrA
VYVANGISFSIGAALTVVLIRAFVFRDSRFQLGADVLLTFVTNGTMLMVGMAFLWFLVDVIAINPYWAKLLTNALTFVVNYFVRVNVFKGR